MQKTTLNPALYKKLTLDNIKETFEFNLNLYIDFYHFKLNLIEKNACYGLDSINLEFQMPLLLEKKESLGDLCNLNAKKQPNIYSEVIDNFAFIVKNEK